MNGTVTRHYLRRWFWIATLVLLVTLATSAGIVTLTLGVQANKDNHMMAFLRLGGAVTRLELELDRLTHSAEDETTDRKMVRSAFVQLLTEFRAISVSHGDAQVFFGRGSPGGRSDGHLAGLGAEFGVDAVKAAARWSFGVGSMPDTLEKLWKSGEAGPSGGAPLSLEASIARLLLLSAPMVRGEGSLSSAEQQRFREIEALIFEGILPMAARVSEMLEAENDSTVRSATFVVLALSGLGIMAALLGFVAIFRLLERAVMANQAEIISERDKAVAARLAKRNFLSVVSHELRTPMNGVLGFASLLAASDLKPKQRKQVEIIQSSGKALLSLVDDILDFSKLEAGSLALENEDFSIEEVVSDVVTLLRAGAAEKRLEMSVYLDARLPERSRGDANRLRQILTNLVGNAIKFTDSGHIGIEAREVSASSGPRGGCELELAVSDTGIGIPADKTGLIFERFTQIASSARRKCGGTGLGLSICKQLVEKMGGRIWVESVPGAGSSFFVRIPLAAASPVAGSERRAAAVAAWSGRRVLVVDGHSISQRLSRLQLESYGLRVEDAADAQGGWALLEKAAAAQDPYAAAILDHAMPGIGGAELARRIRADARFTGLRLLLTTSAGTCDLAEARRLGFDAVEEKPVLPRALIGALRRLIGDEADVADRAAGASAAKVRAGETPGDTGAVRILLVEDDRVGQHLVLEMLSRSQYRVDTVANGLEAVRAVARLPYDLILMDIRMPIVGGVEAARRIRALGGAASRTPVIALTANLQDEDVAEYYAAGMRNVVGKPVDRDILLAAIDAALDAPEEPGEEPREEPGIALARVAAEVEEPRLQQHSG